MNIHKLKIQSHAYIKTLEHHSYIKDSFNNCTFCVRGAIVTSFFYWKQVKMRTHATNTYCDSWPVAAYLYLCCCLYFPEDNSSKPSNCCSYTCRHFNATIYHCTTALWLFSLVLQSLTLPQTQTHRLHAYRLRTQSHTKHGQNLTVSFYAYTDMHSHVHLWADKTCERIKRDKGKTQSDHSLRFWCQQFMNIPCLSFFLVCVCVCTQADEG